MSADDGDRSVWRSEFDEATRAAQVEDDSQAWGAVTGLLLAIISFGLCLAIFTAWITS